MADLILITPHSSCPLRVHAPYNAKIFADEEYASDYTDPQPNTGGTPVRLTPTNYTSSDSNTPTCHSCNSCPPPAPQAFAPPRFNPGHYRPLQYEGHHASPPPCYAPSPAFPPPHPHCNIIPQHRQSHSPYVGGAAPLWRGQPPPRRTPPSPRSVDSMSGSMESTISHHLFSTSTAPNNMQSPPRDAAAAHRDAEGPSAFTHRQDLTHRQDGFSAFPETFTDAKRKRRSRRPKKGEENDDAQRRSAATGAPDDSEEEDGASAELVNLYIPQLTLRPLPYDMFEDRDERRAQRKHQIDLGRQTTGYSVYSAVVPKHERQQGNPNHPITPRVDVRAPRRQWKKACSAWRQQLHLWDSAPHPADMSDPSLPSLGSLGLEPVPSAPEESQ